jgi:TolA-binding protein
VPGGSEPAGSGSSGSGASGTAPAAGSAEPSAPGTPGTPAAQPTDPKTSEAGQGTSNRPAGGPTGATGGAPDADDIEMDPTTADDPAPASARPANAVDEAANAPKTTEEIERHDTEKRAPAAPQLATTMHAAVQLIQDGKHDLAMASLRALGKKNPASAYIPFLLGNLYYDRQWWTVAMEHYAVAIKKNGQYRSNPTIIRSVIRMMASDKTSRKAQGFLKFTVGRPALPYVRYAAAHDGNGQVRRAAGWLARNL